MKQTLLLSFLLLLVAFGRGQSIIAYPNDSAAITATATDAFEPVPVHLYVINNTLQTQTYTWQLTDYAITAPGWGVQLCDNNNCYDMVINPGPYTSLDVPAGDTMDMKFQFVTYCEAGSGNANVVIYVTGDSAATAIKLSYKADIAVACTGINEPARAALAVYPNPAQNNITLSGIQVNDMLTLNVYDLSGKLLQTEILNGVNGNITAPVSGLEAGAYMVKVIDAAGSVKGMARFNKVQ